MSRVSEKPACADEIKKTLRDWAEGGGPKPKMAERAAIILGAVEGRTDAAIAQELGTRPNTVGQWRRRFIEHGLDGLFDRPRPGKTPKYDPAETRKALRDLLKTPPPEELSAWTAKAAAERLGVSIHKVWRVLKAEGVNLQRHRR
jgi:transposase